MKSVLVKERAETKERIAALKAETKLEKLRKEELECSHELVILKRPSILEWLRKLFKKGE